MEAAESKIKVPVIGEGFPSAFKMATSCCKLVGQRVRDGHLDSLFISTLDPILVGEALMT